MALRNFVDYDLSEANRVNAVWLNGIDAAVNYPLSGITGSSTTDTLAEKLAQHLSITDFPGVVGDGVTDCKTGIDIAIATAVSMGYKSLFVPAGNFNYVGQLSLPSGLLLYGESQAKSTLNFYSAGYGLLINGIGTGLRDLSIVQRTANSWGIEFSTATTNTEFCFIENCFIVGPGRRATKPAISGTYNVGAKFSRTNGAIVCYYNTIRDCQFSGWDVDVEFDAPGTPSLGANNNSVFNSTIQTSWYGYLVRSIQNRIQGGQWLQTGGTDASNVFTAVYVTSSVISNYIDIPGSEPGPWSTPYQFDASSSNTWVSKSFNFDIPGTDLGSNVDPSYRLYEGIQESYYYMLTVATFTADNQTVSGSFAWAARNGVLNGTASGVVSLSADRMGGAVTAKIHNSSGHKVNEPIASFTGVFTDATTLRLVFHMGSVGGVNASTTLALQLLGSAGNGSSLSLPATIQNNLAVDPATVGWPLQGSATYDPGSLADGAGVTTTVAVAGANLGDFAEASFSNALQGITLTAWVSSAGVISVRFQNETGGVLDLASGTLRASARQPL